MLNRLRKPFSHRVAEAVAPGAELETVKIVHAGGSMECYYMAIPALKIMEKYPSFILTRPEVFRRPWDSVVGPDEILPLGEKFFVVPRGTVKKLRRRIRKPDIANVLKSSGGGGSSTGDVSVSVSVKMVSSCSEKDNNINSHEQSGSFIISAFRKKSAIKKHVRFANIIEVKQKAAGDEKVVDKPKPIPGKSLDSQSDESQSHEHKGKRKPRNAWQPSLISINERIDE